MWQSSWDAIPSSNKLKSIKKEIIKWYILCPISPDVLKLLIQEQELFIPIRPTSSTHETSIHHQPTLIDRGSTRKTQHTQDP